MGWIDLDTERRIPAFHDTEKIKSTADYNASVARECDLAFFIWLASRNLYRAHSDVRFSTGVHKLGAHVRLVCAGRLVWLGVGRA